jgi:hypothetical protein
VMHLSGASEGAVQTPLGQVWGSRVGSVRKSEDAVAC